MFEVMDLGWIDAFGGVKNLRSVLPSGYEMCLKRLCNLVKSKVLADSSMKIGDTVFRTFV